MLAAEIEHLLGFGDADVGTGKTAAAHDQRESGHGQRFRRSTDNREIAVATQQAEISVDVMIGGNGVEDEIEALIVLLHFVGIARDDDRVGAETKRILFFLLTNNNTASAAEIVSGALKDNNRAIIMGVKTFGTGTVLDQFDLSDGSAILLGTSEWLTPDGQFIRDKGIQPNIVVKNVQIRILALSLPVPKPKEIIACNKY